MTNIVFTTLPFTGHLHTSCTLADAVSKLGYTTHIVVPEEIDVSKFNVNKVVIGKDYLPKDYLASFSRCSEGLTGREAILRVNKELLTLIKMNLTYLPGILRELKTDLLVIDHIAYEVSLVARYLKLPFIINGSSINFNRDGGRLPPAFTTNPPGLTSRQITRNLKDYAEMDFSVRDMLFTPINEMCRDWNVPKLTTRCLDELYEGRLLEVYPSIKEFDLPHTLDIKYTGPWLSKTPADKSTELPFNRLAPERPLVYASFGTIVNRQEKLLQVIAEACDDVGVELVVGLGGGLKNSEVPRLPGATTLLDYAPQRLVLSHVDAFITHGGINSVMEALSLGVPLLCLPISNDQPGTAVRIKHAGVGGFILPAEANRENVGALLTKILCNTDYEANAKIMARLIAESKGVDQAAAYIDAAYRKYSESGQRRVAPKGMQSEEIAVP